MRIVKGSIFVGTAIGALAAIGCEYHAHDSGPEPVAVGYTTDDPYYYQGGYEGDYWVWHDREGHDHREARAEHERRIESSSHHDVQRNDRGEHFDQSRQGARPEAYQHSSSGSAQHEVTGERGGVGREGAGHQGAAAGEAHGGEAHGGGESHGGEAGGVGHEAR